MKMLLLKIQEKKMKCRLICKFMKQKSGKWVFCNFKTNKSRK